MRIQKTEGKYRVELYNGHHAGDIVWDQIWEVWRFNVRSCSLSYYYMKKITKFMKKLK